MDFASEQTPTHAGSGLLGLWLPGCLLGGVLVAGAVAAGFVPEAARRPALAGAAAGALLGFPGVALKLRAARQPHAADGSSPLTGGVAAVQIAVLTDFLVNAVAIGAGLVGMSLTGMKFNAIAGFGLAYATIALTIQVLSGVGLARSLRSSSVPDGGPEAADPAAEKVAPSAAPADTNSQRSSPARPVAPDLGSSN